MTQIELKQISEDLINGKGEEKLSTLTEEEKIMLLDILKDTLQNSLAVFCETIEEAKQVIKETREEIAYTQNELSRVKDYIPMENISKLLN